MSVRFAILVALIGATLAPQSAAFAQGRLVPGGCILVRRAPIDDRIIGDCRPMSPSIVRTRADVRVELVDRVLRYEVEERLVNRGNTVGEADYLFPLPAGAAFQDLKLSINGELVAGETLGAEEARRIYEEIVRRQRDPALVEWMGMGLLRARIFPINPGEEKRIVVRYQSVARREGDAVRVDWFGQRANPGATGTSPSSPSVTFSLRYPDNAQYGRAYSPTHELDLLERSGSREVAVRGDARDVTVLIPVRGSLEPSIAGLAHAPATEDGFALITVSPPMSMARATSVMPRDITLVLDVSGSMVGKKMEQARAAANQLLGTLTARDRFRLIDFATDVHSFPERGAREAPYSAVTPQSLRAAREYIADLDASGSTNIGDALREAVRPAVDGERLGLVLFITDGEPTVGERNADALVELLRSPSAAAAARGTRRIFTFGVGADVNVSLLEQLAMDGAGTSHFVRPEESVERAVGLVASRLVDPILTDVRVRAEGGARFSRMLPPRGSDLFAGQDLVVLARYTGNGPTRVIVEGTRNGAPIRWVQDIDFPERDRSNLFVARLWATQRVGYLSAERRRNGPSTELDREIRELGERYGIPTLFTSYFVKEEGMALPPSVGSIGNARGGRGGGGGGGGGGGRGAASGSVGGGSAANGPVSATAQADFGKVAQFEAARAAADQRAVTTVGGIAAEAASNGVRTIDSRSFALRDSVWTDAKYTPSMRTVRIRPYSRAWFDAVARFPELTRVFALGDRVIVAGRTVAIIVSSTGVDTLTAKELDALVAGW